MKTSHGLKKKGSLVPVSRRKQHRNSEHLSIKQDAVINALRAGITYKEVMRLLSVKYGVISNWKRRDTEFRRALNEATAEGIPKRAKLKSLDYMIQRYGDNFYPGPEFRALLDARAHARASADGRAGVDVGYSHSKPRKPKMLQQERAAEKKHRTQRRQARY